MGRAALILLVAALALSSAGCAFTMGRFAVATTHPVPLESLRARTPGGRAAHGEACTRIVVGFPIDPLPNIERAIDRALVDAHGLVLTDVVVHYRMWYVPFIGGRVCYVADGIAR